LWSVR
jgi:hypothetical protein